MAYVAFQGECPVCHRSNSLEYCNTNAHLEAKVALLMAQLAESQAREAKLRTAVKRSLHDGSNTLLHTVVRLPSDDTALREMIATAVAEEREACAKVCDPKPGLRFAPNYADGLRDCASAIRARKP